MKNEVYKIKLIKTENPITGLLLNKTIKAVGHKNEGILLMINHKSKETSYINRNNYLRIEYSKELFVIKAERMEEQSQGQIDADKLLKE